MAISVDESTGWSQTLAVKIADDPYDESSYSTNGASWYMRSWFSHSHWARMYKNNSTMTTILTKLSFRVCPGHSGGKEYAIASKGLPTGETQVIDGVTRTGPWNVATAEGHGCTFFVDLYVVDSEGNRIAESKDIEGGDVPNIDRYNCSAGGRGGTNPYTNTGTGFGKLNLYNVDGKDEAGVDWRGREGHPRYREHVKLTIPEEKRVKVPVGGTLFVHVYAKDDDAYWTSTDPRARDRSLLVVQSDGDGNFTEETIVEDTDYIWVMTSEGWKKSKVAYEMTSDGWEALKE